MKCLCVKTKCCKKINKIRTENNSNQQNKNVTLNNSDIVMHVLQSAVSALTLHVEIQISYQILMQHKCKTIGGLELFR